MQIENKEMIINFGAFGYKAEKMSLILGVEKAVIEEELKNPKSLFSEYYKSGIHKSDYVIDLKLFEMAQNGDLKALEEYEYRKKQRK